MRLNQILTAVLGMACVTMAIAVPIHKWVDANGNVHYSNVAPPQGKSTVLEYRGLGDTGVTTQKQTDPSKPVVEKENPELKKRIEEEKAAARQNCIKSKESVQMLESGVRITRYTAKGDKEVLDDKARKEELERAQKSVKEWCEEPK